jgi:hypothetical protein
MSIRSALAPGHHLWRRDFIIKHVQQVKTPALFRGLHTVHLELPGWSRDKSKPYVHYNHQYDRLAN